MINYIISECSKRAPKEFYTSYDWEVILWELCKISKFDKCYTHKPEAEPENEAHKIL